jgi:hypothetical protein
MVRKLQTYYEFKLNLELCNVNTFEKDDEIRKLYDQYTKDRQQTVVQMPIKHTNKAIKKAIG